jgi:hypothetical protein
MSAEIEVRLEGITLASEERECVSMSSMYVHISILFLTGRILYGVLSKSASAEPLITA